MDEVKIVSGFTKTIISKMVQMFLRKKVGCDIGIQLNNMNVMIDNGKTHIHLDIDAELNKDDLIKLLKNAGLN